MRWIRLLSVLILLVVSLRAGVGAARGQETWPQAVGSPNRWDLDGPISGWTESDLRKLVDLAVGEQITVPEAQKIWEQLTDEQRAKVGELLALKVGIQREEWLMFVQSNNRRSRWSEWGFTVLGFPGEIWREPIENIWTWGPPPGTTFATSYWNSPYCDDDPNDPDWTFWFYQPYEWYSRNPSGLRWTSKSVQV